MTRGGVDRRTIAAILTVGVVGVLIAGLQPQLLGALEQEGRIDTDWLGLAASAELLAMGLGAGSCGAFVDRLPLRVSTAIATILLVAIDAATPWSTGGGVVVARIAAGLAEGTLIGATIGFIVRSAAPARWSGFYLVAQTLAQLAVAALLGAWIVPAFGAVGGFRVLAAVSALALAAVPFLPARYPPLAAAKDERAAVPARGLLALLGVLLFLASIVAVWVYIEPIARSQGIDRASVAAIVPLSLAMQIAGAALATACAARARPAVMAMLSVAIALVAVGVMGAHAGAPAFLAASGAFGFVWLFALPFQVPLVIAADPSRRAAALIGGAQLIGSGAGPLAAGLLLGARPLGLVLAGGAVGAILSLAALLAAAGRGRALRPRADATMGELTA